LRASFVLWSACLTGWAGLALQPLHPQLPATCGEVSLWLLWQIAEQTSDLKMTAGLATWVAGMVLAMMAPGLYRPVAHIISQSMPRRTLTLLLLFFVAYVAVWLPVVAFLLLGSGALLRGAGAGGWAVLPGVLAWYGWSCTPIHQLALNRAHVLRPLRSFSGASCDASGLGTRHGSWCVLSCWPLMLLPMLTIDLSGLLMAASSVCGALLRALPPRAVRWHPWGFLPLRSALVVTWQWSAWRAARVVRISAASLASRRTAE